MVNTYLYEETLSIIMGVKLDISFGFLVNIMLVKIYISLGSFQIIISLKLFNASLFLILGITLIFIN